MWSKSVTLELTSDTALVFYDWLTRFNQREEATFADQALVAQARSHVREECA